VLVDIVRSKEVIHLKHVVLVHLDLLLLVRVQVRALSELSEHFLHELLVPRLEFERDLVVPKQLNRRLACFLVVQKRENFILCCSLLFFILLHLICHLAKEKAL